MPDIFKYNEYDLRNPAGQNGLSSLASFYQRYLYKNKIYPSTFPPPLDVWYDKLLYGRVDPVQNSIIPSTKNLKIIRPAVSQDIKALNVVASAFEKFAAHIQKALIMGVLDRKGAFGVPSNPDLLELKAHKGYESPNSKYAYFTQGLYDVFFQTLTGDQNDRIKDFYTFLDVYVIYLQNMSSITPITKTNYLLSNNGSIFTSGLSIAISNKDAGDDSIKNESFIRDPNFDFFRGCAKKFGFTVNKNAPWILTADLFTSAFKAVALERYVGPKGARTINKSNFFDIFYDKTYLTDFDDLIRILMNSYSNFVRSAPFYDKGKETLNKNCRITPKARVPLKVTSQQVIKGEVSHEDVLPAKFLIDLYTNLRQCEAKFPLSQAKLQSVKSEAYEKYHLRPNKNISRLQNVAHYVNLVFRDYIYDHGAIGLQFKNAVVVNRASNK